MSIFLTFGLLSLSSIVYIKCFIETDDDYEKFLPAYVILTSAALTLFLHKSYEN